MEHKMINKMKTMLPSWNTTVLFLLLISYSTPSTYSQNNKKNWDVTPTMAKKISYLCQSNDRVFIFFANSMGITNYRDADIIIRSLDKKLDYAEKFIVNLYASYGVEMSYFTLKDAGFTIPETDKAELIWEKTQKKWKKEEEKNNKKRIKNEHTEKLEKERKILSSVLNDSIFNFQTLSKTPQININMADLASHIKHWKTENSIGQDDLIDCSFDCIISKEGKLSLIIPSVSRSQVSEDGRIKLTTPQEIKKVSNIHKLFYDYILNNAIIQNPGLITLEQLDTTIAVSSKTTLHFTQIKRHVHTSTIEFKMKKDKKTKIWRIINEDKLRFQLIRIGREKSNIIYSDLKDYLYHTSNLETIKKKSCLIKAEIFENEIDFLIEGNTQERFNLPYTFDIIINKATNNSLWYILGGIGLLISGSAAFI